MSTIHSAPPARRLLQEPYRLLFPLGALAGMLGVGHWLAYAAGWSDAYSGFFHAGVQMQVYVTAFVAGFLMTAMPRFTGTAPAAPVETLGVAALLLGVVGALASGAWVAAQAAFVVAVLTLVAFFVRRLVARRREAKKPRARPPVELIWVPFALLQAVAGAALLAGGQAGWLSVRILPVGRSMLQEGFVLGIVVGVGGFLAPRLMGTYRLPPSPGSDAGEAGRTRLRLAANGTGAALLAASFVAHGFGLLREADLLRAILVTAFLIGSGALSRRPAVRDQYVHYVWLSFWLITLGLWGAALLPGYRVAALHLVFVGGYSLLIFAVATMVVLSHAGEANRLRRAGWPLRLTGGGVLAALALRIASVALPEHYFELLGAAATLWLVAAVVWLLHVGPYLGRTIPVVDLERMHESSKLRVLATRQGRC